MINVNINFYINSYLARNTKNFTLKYLDLYNNKICVIPKEIYQLKKLQYLDFCYNTLDIIESQIIAKI